MKTHSLPKSSLLVLAALMGSALVLLSQEPENSPSKRMNIEKLIVPEGEYYIGDLCYVIRNEWPEIVDLYFQSLKAHPKKNLHQLSLKTTQKAPLSPVMFFTGSDGTYTVQNEPKKGTNNQTLCVDSGTIGIVQTSTLNPKILEEAKHLGIMKKFEEPTAISYENKIISIGSLKILQEE